jgi:N-acetylneuraminic acid mutarotase
MDLKAENPQWQVLDQPFERRALIVAVHKDKIFVIGGFNENEEPIRRVEIYDPASNSWSQGPELPGKEINGFAPAACALNDRLYASVADGRLYRLNEENQSWEEIARTTPRIVHRLIPDGSRILVVGGANKGKNFDLIEVVDLQELPTGQLPRQARREKTD